MIQLQKATTKTATDQEGTNKTTNERTCYLIQCASVVPKRFGSVLGFRLRYGGVEGGEGTCKRGGRRLERAGCIHGGVVFKSITRSLSLRG
jgi:hypothetical protein